MIVKAYIGVTFMMVLRWSLPRLRIDQVMTTCLKYCLPLVSVMLAGAMLWVFFLPTGVSGKIFPGVSVRVEKGKSTEKKIDVERKQAPPAGKNVILNNMQTAKVDLR